MSARPSIDSAAAVLVMDWINDAVTDHQPTRAPGGVWRTACGQPLPKVGDNRYRTCGHVQALAGLTVTWKRAHGHWRLTAPRGE